MEDSTRNDNRTAAEELARMLETTPSPLSSLKLDHATLVARLAALMPFIEAFALCTTVCWKGEVKRMLGKELRPFQKNLPGL